MADSSSPEPQDAAAPSALTPSIDPATDQAARAAVVRRVPAPGRRPLPDAVAIHLIAVPDAAPPYDDTPQTRGRRASATRPRKSAASGRDAGRAIAAVADVSRPPAGRPDLGQFAGHWPSRFAQVLAETLAGSRPPSQLTPWTTQQARRRISQLGPVLSTAHRPRIRRVIVTSPTGGVLEMTVIVGLGTRVRALAVRLERTRTPAIEAGDSPGGQPAELAPAGQQQPQAAVRRGSSGRHGPPDQPGWICTAVEAA